jgi:histidinol-phosphate aminotransferase
MTHFDPTQLLRQDLSDFPPYSMGHVPLADLDHLIKLDLNENPFGPSPKAIAALAQMRHYNRYIGQDELREAIARYVGVDVSHIVVSNGADEMIDWVQRVFLNRGDAIVDCPPSFEMYAFFARVNGARILAVPRRDDFSIDVDAIERAVLEGVIASEAKQSPSRDVEIASSQSFDSASLRSGSLLATLAPHASAGVTQAKLIFLANPSNPDGGMASRPEIERLLALPVMLVLDEAYAEFAGESYAARVPTQSNLIVLRTFSKWAGLASLRVGYCIAPQPIAAKILQIKAPENVNAAGIVAALASLDDREYLMANVRRIVAGRERLSVALAQLGFLQPLPSHANFVLCRVVGRDARQIYNALAARGILIRAFGSPRLRDYIRIAVGTPDENEVLVKALKEITDG